MSQDEADARLYESIADDERLRGSLTDTAYGPLLNWAARRASELANAAGDDEFELIATALHDAMAALVAAVEVGDPACLETVDSSVLPEEARTAAADALLSAEADPDARAQAVAEALETAGP
jgi:hypothetical protein